MSNQEAETNPKSLGGKARANNLTEFERISIARLGGLAKKAKMSEKTLPVSTSA